MYCVSRKESLAKALISVGVPGDKCVFSIRRVSGLERPLPGRLVIRGNKINVCEGMGHVLGQVSRWGDGGNW